MPSIAIGLPECGFLEDLPNVTFADVTTTAYATVKLDNVTLLSNIRLTPDKSNRIVIYAKPMIRSLVPLTGPKPITTLLPMLQVQLRVGTTTLSTSCAVVPGGTDSPERIDEAWFTHNFLTWQPQIIETTRLQPQWLAYISTSRFKRSIISSVLYTRDGRRFEKDLFSSFGSSALYFRQVQTDFMHLWGDECERQDLDPIAYDVFGKGTNSIELTQTADLTSGEQVPINTVLVTRYVQRYILRPERFNDVCFGFENTLGGFDTLMLEGKQTFQPEGDVTTFKTEAVEKELVNNFTSIWEANTGRLETERAATQFQDFLKSTNRYIFRSGAWRKIIVSEYKVKHYRGESNSYSFKYHLAERAEGRFFDRAQLPELELPTKFFPKYDYKKM